MNDPFVTDSEQAVLDWIAACPFSLTPTQDSKLWDWYDRAVVEARAELEEA